MNRRIVFWIATFAAVISAVVLLRAVLLPFVAGMVLAYLLNPVAGRFERWGANRLLATLAILIIAGGVIATLVVLTLPPIVGELSDFVENLPLYVNRLHTLASDTSRPWLSKLVGEGLADAEHSVGELTTLASNWFVTVLHSIWSGGQALLSFFSLAVVTPIVALYLIHDWDRMLATVERWVPPARRETVRILAKEIDATIRSYVLGQGSLCLVLAAFYACALLLIGLKHAALIGVAAGLLSFIPYVGSLSGLAISLCIAIAQFWPSWTPTLLVLAVFLVGQSLADYVLAPYLIGRRVHLNPVWMMFALFAFAYLFGFFGLVIAGPLAAAIGVLMRFVLRQYYASPIYVEAAASPAQEKIAEPAGSSGGRPVGR